MGKNNSSRLIEDSILAGILDAFRVIRVTPQQNEYGRVVFKLDGDVDNLMERLYRNEPVGALDALRAIKSARQAIFNFRDQKRGDEKEKGQTYNGNRR